MLRVILLDEAFYGKETVFLTKTMEVEREFLRIFSRDRNAFRDADCLALMQDIDSAKRQGDYGVVTPFGESSISCLSTGCKFGLIVLYYEKKGPAKLITEFGAAGDTDTARSLLSDGYIQHNLAYGTGADAFIGSVEYLASADVKTTVNNIRAFEDGDKVFLQTIYNFAGAGEQVAFDIFRFDEDGKIAEHWDVMETIADQSTWQNQNGKF